MQQVNPTIERYIEAIERGDADAFAALFAEDAVGIHPLAPEPLRGRDAIRATEEALYASFSDIEVEVRSMLEADRQCAVEVVLSATNTGPLDLGAGTPLPPTGRRVSVPSTWWVELGEDGLITESRDYFDTGTFMRQLGLGEQ